MANRSIAPGTMRTGCTKQESCRDGAHTRRLSLRLTMVAAILSVLTIWPIDAIAQQADDLSLDQLRSLYTTPADRVMELGGTELRYRDEGPRSAEVPILLLHGSNSSVDSWDGVAEALVAAGHRVLRFDQPPFGLSGPIDEETMRILPDSDALVKGFLDRLGVQSVIITGVSSGGTIGYYFAAKYPSRVGALIISNAPADPVETSALRASADYPAELTRAEATGIRARDFWAAYLRYYSGDPESVTEDQISLFHDIGRRRKELNLFHLYALAGNQEETLTRLGQVTVSTLLLWGKSDILLPASAAFSLRDKLTATDPSLIFLDDVGHYPPIEAPLRFAALVDVYVCHALISVKRSEPATP